MVLKGRVALITGAASGIGRALACSLAHRGTHLALVDRDPAGLATTMELAGGGGARISTHVADITDQSAIDRMAAELLAAHGGLDILVNNAGAALAGSFAQTSQEEFEWLFATNFWGVVKVTRTFLPSLLSSDDARLVNISSLYGVVAPRGATAYAASKFAVRGFSQSLRSELRHSPVGVTVVYPGGVRTAIARNARVPASINRTESDRIRRHAGQFLKLSPADAAGAIVTAIERRRRRVVIGRDARLFVALERLLPERHARILDWMSRPK